MNKLKIGLFTLVGIVALALFSAPARADSDKTIIYLFWGNGCPHCAAEKQFLSTLQDKYPELEIKDYETWYDKDNATLFEKMAAVYQLSPPYFVPTTFIGDFEPLVGFGTAATTGEQIEDNVVYCVKNGCSDPGEKLARQDNSSTQTNPSEIQEKKHVNKIVDLPIFGTIDVAESGIFVFSILVGLLDGFNACAMWVLCFLLTLLVYSQSRKRIFLIGGTFIFVSAAMYFVFIAGWMNFFIFAGSLKAIQIGIGVLAIIFGLVNIKDFFLFGKGVSFVIPEKSKKNILKKIRQVVKPSAQLSVALLGVAVLAAGVNLIELLCTLGLPVVYTGILASYDFPPLVNYFYLLIYILFYMIDDLIIFTVVVLTMTRKKFTEKYGRLSKLLSGIVILVLGLVMIINPQLLMLG